MDIWQPASSGYSFSMKARIISRDASDLGVCISLFLCCLVVLNIRPVKTGGKAGRSPFWGKRPTRDPGLGSGGMGGAGGGLKATAVRVLKVEDGVRRKMNGRRKQPRSG